MTNPEEQLPVLGPEAQVERAALAPGRGIRRWTEETPAGVYAPLPCHAGQAVRLDPEAARSVAICRICSQSYRATLTPDSDGSYFADFAVTYVRYLLSRARKGIWS